jgi:hypothetical protein
MPVGFCCENCFLYDKYTTCLKSKSKSEEKEETGTEVIEQIALKDATIEGDLLKIIISQKDGEVKTIYFDLKKHLKS